MRSHALTVVLFSVVLSACQTDSPLPLQEESEEDLLTVEKESVIEPEPIEVNGPSETVIRAMILADMLYEARQAIEDNRLMYPSRDNAYDKYLQVLSIDQSNVIALAGLEDIVQRYVVLADEAVKVRQFEEAERLLERATFINRESEAVNLVRQSMIEAKQNQVEMHALDPQELNSQSPELLAQLGEIAKYLQQHDARFLITARTDEEGRWIYQSMRQSVDGYRLRGNIAIGSRPNIQIESSG